LLRLGGRGRGQAQHGGEQARADGGRGTSRAKRHAAIIAESPAAGEQGLGSDPATGDVPGVPVWRVCWWRAVRWLLL
jgi:hypothetical protein